MLFLSVNIVVPLAYLLGRCKDELDSHQQEAARDLTTALIIPWGQRQRAGKGLFENTELTHWELFVYPKHVRLNL